MAKKGSKKEIKKEGVGEEISIKIDKGTLLTIGIVVALIVGIAVGYALASLSGNVGGKISKEQAGEIVTATIQQAISQQYGGAITPNIDIISVEDEGSYYKVSFMVESQPGEVYVSYDGKKIFLQGMDTATPSKQDTQEPKRVEASPDDDPVLGDENAPITIIEFSDFQCPFCKKFHEETFGKIKEEYIDTGKVKFVYRDFPLGFHKNAFITAMAAECADDQGKFWEYADILFTRQSEWEGMSKEEIIDKLVEYASELGLDTTDFRECVESEKYKDEVQKDLEDGQKYGVSGTPAFFINGIPVSGALPYETFKKILDEELARVGASSS